MAQASVSDVTLYAPGVPSQVGISEVTLEAPPFVVGVGISNVTLEAPPAGVDALGQAHATWSFRTVVNAGMAARADILPATLDPRVRIATSVDQRLGAIVTAWGWRVVVNASKPITTSTQLSVGYAWRVLVDAFLAPPIVLDTTARRPGPMHLAWPLSLRPDGSLAAVEQNSDADLDQTAGVLLSTELGSRRALPAFGFADHTYRDAPTDDEISDVITLWDPRVGNVATELSQAGDELTVKVSIRKGV